MDDNIVRLPPRPASHTPSADALAAYALAEMSRKLCLEAAAGYVEILQHAVRANPRNVSADRMDLLLGEVASSIRELKLDPLPTPLAGPTPGDAA